MSLLFILSFFLLTPLLIHSEALSLPINLHLPSSLPSPPIHSLSPLFHNTALCSLIVNHISVSFIRLCALLTFSEQRHITRHYLYVTTQKWPGIQLCFQSF